MYFQKNEFVYYTDDKPLDILFIIKGSSLYVDDLGNVLTTFPKGAILGEIEIILGRNRRFMNLQAKENSEMNMIKSEDFKRILMNFNNEYISTAKIVKNKYNRYFELIELNKSKGLKNER